MTRSFGSARPHQPNADSGASRRVERATLPVAYAVRRRTTESIPGAFSLGRFAWPVIAAVLIYTVVVMLALSAPAAFHGSDRFLGYGIGLAVVWYAAVLLWRLRRGTAGVTDVAELVETPGRPDHDPAG